MLARLVRGLGLHCCLLRAASISAGTDFSKASCYLWCLTAKLQFAPSSSNPCSSTTCQEQCAVLVQQMDIVIGTPLRLARLARAGGGACFGAVEWVVLDEAYKLLDEAFLRQTDRILAACTHPRKARAAVPAFLLGADPLRGRSMSGFLVGQEACLRPA